MNCHYCNKPCKVLSSSWRCEPCKAEYFRAHTNLTTEINNYTYIFQMRWEHAQYPARIISGRSTVNLPKIPSNITPTNVNEKVRLYLLFS
jgi:hypothetical protein